MTCYNLGYKSSYTKNTASNLELGTEVLKGCYEGSVIIANKLISKNVQEYIAIYGYYKKDVTKVLLTLLIN